MHRSVCAAIGEFAGGPAQGYRVPEFASLPLALGGPEGSAEWRDKAADYVAYIAAWLDRSDRDGRWEPKVDDFDAWLRQRARRQEQLEQGELSRWDRILHWLLRG